MLDDYSLLSQEKALLVSVTCPQFEFHETHEKSQTSLSELIRLLNTLKIKSVESFIQKRQKVEAGTILGTGKLKEISERAKELDCNLLVFDFELKPGQIKKIQALTELKVIDRNYVILEIFAGHAQTSEAKIQIEMARLEYLLPRLTSYWSHFGRQRGGVGVRGGEGEQQLELDRRMIRKKIQQCKKQLQAIEKSRIEQAKRRQKKTVTAALIGYTNAGKSSLMNGLCQVQIQAEDKLFATLDTTHRTLNPDTKPPLILIDTVGFLSNLPNTLLSGFRTTLDSAAEADLLLIVVDIADPNHMAQIDVTLDVLKDLDIGQKEKFFVFTKKDLLGNSPADLLSVQLTRKKFPDHYLVSTHDQQDMLKLRDEIIDFFLKQQHPMDLFVPFEAGEVHSRIQGKTNVLKWSEHENGIYYKVRAPDFILKKLNLKDFLLSNEEKETLFPS